MLTENTKQPPHRLPLKAWGGKEGGDTATSPRPRPAPCPPGAVPASAPRPPPAGLQPGSGCWRGAVRPGGGKGIARFLFLISLLFIIVVVVSFPARGREAVFQMKNGIIERAAAAERWFWGERQVFWRELCLSGMGLLILCLGDPVCPVGVAVRCVALP